MGGAGGTWQVKPGHGWLWWLAVTVKDTIKASPAGPALTASRQLLRRVRFPGSGGYWQRRYDRGGNSGAGSYGEIAEYKAEFLNEFIAKHDIRSVVEFGCGDGAQLALADYPKYVGLDVAKGAIGRCMRRFQGDRSKSFLAYDPAHWLNNGAITGDVVLSLDVVLHLVENPTLDLHLKHVFEAASRYVVFFTENEDRPMPDSPHVRYRRVADWAIRVPGWEVAEHVPSPVKGADSQADFFVFERRSQTRPTDVA